MKKTIVLLLVLTLTFAVVIPASAGGNGPGAGNGNGYAGANGTGIGAGTGTGTGNGSTSEQQGSSSIFAITGAITAIGTDSVTVTVIRGNKLAQSYIGLPVTVTVSLQTRYLYHTDTATTIIKFVDLKLGQPVSVNGTVANDIWTASRITVGAKLSCLP